MSDLRLVLLDKNGLALYVNPEDVSTAHEQRDPIHGMRTVITMRTGEKHVVTDPLRDTVERLSPKFSLFE